MEDESTTFGLSHRQLAGLWNMGQDSGEDHVDRTDEQTKAELLADLLAGSLPPTPGVTDMLPSTLNQVCEGIMPFVGNTFKHLLLSPETDLVVIEAIKDHHKSKAEAAPSDLDREVATVVYYAAIASALVFHGCLITKFSYEDLQRSFSQLLGETRTIPELADFFARARDICAQHVDE